MKTKLVDLNSTDGKAFLDNYYRNGYIGGLYDKYKKPNKNSIEMYNRVCAECESLGGARVVILSGSNSLYCCAYEFELPNGSTAYVEHTRKERTVFVEL